MTEQLQMDVEPTEVQNEADGTLKGVFETKEANVVNDATRVDNATEANNGTLSEAMDVDSVEPVGHSEPSVSTAEPSTVSDKPTIQPLTNQAPHQLLTFGESKEESGILYTTPKDENDTEKEPVSGRGIVQYSQKYTGNATTGTLRAATTARVVSEEEEQKERNGEIRFANQSERTMTEKEVRALTVSELRIRGFGRAPTGFCYSSRMTLHQPLESYNLPGNSPHPEQPSRIIKVFRTLDDHGLISRMRRVAVREAVRQEVMLVHSEEHWLKVRSTCYQPLEYLEKCTEYFERLSLYVNAESFDCARLSCGGVIEMGRAIAEGQIRNGFAIVRPPGHHAEPEAAMGFCFFNNVAVTAKWLRTVYADQSIQNANGDTVKLERILILDWDVHHGNGTQKAFYDDGNVMYISLHRHDGYFYPGGDYGSAEKVGEGAGEGYSVNIPFREKGMTDADYLYAFQQVVMPIAHEFRPDFVIVSAGFDAALGDELGLMKVSPAGFAHMTHMLSSLANGRLLIALEGGYNVDAIARSALECVKVLVGEDPKDLGALPPVSHCAHSTVAQVKAAQSRYWSSMGDRVLSRDELGPAGETATISEILKRYRTATVGSEYGLFSVDIQDERLADAYRDQLLCTPNVYDCDVLVLFMHDMGVLKAAVSGASLDLDVEKTVLLDSSRAVLDWALRRNSGPKYGVIDVNFLVQLPTLRDGPPVANRDPKLEMLLASYVWNAFVHLSKAQDVILIGSGCGSQALVHLVETKSHELKQRVRACVSVLGLEKPRELDASSGVRPWYKENSLVLVPSNHPLLEDARKAGKHQKKYGTIYRPEPEDEGRAIFLLKASMPKIEKFVDARLTVATADVSDGPGVNNGQHV